MQWEIEFDQDRFKNMEDTWTEKYDRYLAYTVYHWGFCLIFKIALSALCLLFCVPNLLPQVHCIFLIAFQILNHLIFHTSHICIFQLKLLDVLS